MFVTKHPSRYLVNMNHREMEVLRKVVDAGLLLLEGEDESGLWATFTQGHKITLGKWGGNPLAEITGPRQPKPRQSKPQPKPQPKPLSSVT